MSLKRKLKNKVIIIVSLIIIFFVAVVRFVLYLVEPKSYPGSKYEQAVEFLRNEFSERISRENFDEVNTDLTYGKERPAFYPPNEKFRFISKIYFFSKPDTYYVNKTKGGKVQKVRVGYVKINYNGKEYRLIVNSYVENNYIIYFRDLTNGKTTFELGRFIRLNNDGGKYLGNPEDFEYEIDFNFAYFLNRYNIKNNSLPIYEDNKLDFAVEAGERFNIKE
jgi:uncharacterized protein (DUF1684 family)